MTRGTILQKSLLAALCAVAAAAPATAAVTTYSDLGSFTAAAGPTTLFDFNATPNGSFGGTSYDVGPFTLTGDSTGGFSDLEVIAGQVNGNVCSSCNPAFGYSIAFEAPITAFGALYRNAFGGSGLTFTVDGVSFSGPTQNDGFFGFTSDTAFSTILVSGGNEVHNFDDVRFGVAAAGAVPEPATWAMMVGGFGLLGGALRRRAAQPVLA